MVLGWFWVGSGLVLEAAPGRVMKGHSGPAPESSKLQAQAPAQAQELSRGKGKQGKDSCGPPRTEVDASWKSWEDARPSGQGLCTSQPGSCKPNRA